jgi:hypothetical protein
MPVAQPWLSKPAAPAEAPSSGQAAPGAPANYGYTAYANLMVTVRDLGKLDAVQVALEQALAPYLNTREVHFLHSDPAAAHRLAVERAFAMAAREAETYASALHLHVGRLVRVSNAKPAFNFSDLYQRMGLAALRPGGPRDTFAGMEAAAVAADYELVP